MTDPGLPSVSAIIATRGRPTLGRAIEGVLGQRYDGRVTCIVVFDGVDPIDLSDIPTGERRSLVAVANGRTPGWRAPETPVPTSRPPSCWRSATTTTCGGPRSCEHRSS